MNYDAIILAAGEFPRSPQLIDAMLRAECLVACDGAVANLLAANITPSYVVGDLDSLAPELRLLLGDLVHHNPDQETNDLTKAARFVLELGKRRVLILGATGLREDHALGNISLLADYAQLFDEVEMRSDYGTFRSISRTTTFTDVNPGAQVSIFALSPLCPISTDGLRWRIERRLLTSWWEGTLNETLGSEFTVELEGEGRVLVYIALS